MMLSCLLWLVPLFTKRLPWAALLLFIRLARLLYTGIGMKVLLYSTGLPTIVASLAWVHADSFPALWYGIVPCSAFALFAFSVSCGADLWFAAVWLLLPLLGLFGLSGVYALVRRALCASLVAHMAGAALAVASGATYEWYAYSALVPVERCIAAAGMVVCAVILDAVQMRKACVA